MFCRINHDKGIELGSPQGFQGTRVHGHRVIYWEQGNKTRAKLGRREQKLWLDMLGNRKHQNHKILLGNKGSQGKFCSGRENTDEAHPRVSGNKGTSYRKLLTLFRPGLFWSSTTEGGGGADSYPSPP